MLKKILRTLKSLGRRVNGEGDVKKQVPHDPKAAAGGAHGHGGRPDGRARGAHAPDGRVHGAHPPNDHAQGARGQGGAHGAAAHAGPRAHPPREGSARHAGSGPSGDGEQGGAGSAQRRRGGRGRRPGTGPESTSGRAAPAPAAPEAPPAPPWDPASHVVPPVEGKTRFQDLDIPPEILHAIADLGFQYCTPIQAGTLPATLQGRDMSGRAQTGTGKTAAFLITVFTRFLRNPDREGRRPGSARALVLAPTRELAMQIERDAADLGKHCGVRSVAVYGGEDMDRQRRRLAAGPVDLLIATPGRLLDFHARHEIHLNRVEILIIDEADRMLDMGFIPDVRRIVYSTPHKDRRQTLLFSATLSEPILRLASNWTRDPAKVEIEPENVAVDTVEQIVYVVTASEKWPLLYNLLTREKPERVLVFVNRRDTAERLDELVKRAGFSCALISGALAQNQRTRALEDFREGRIQVLVATDVAGRGLHVSGISHVVNFNTPIDAEDYVHRIGRTGRAGKSGISITFACEEESFYLPAIEAYIGRSLPCTIPEEDWVRLPEGVPNLPPSRPRGPSPFRPGGGRGGPRRGGPPRGGPRRGR
jgi:ATP-dependent RNA helicase RhlB